MRPGGEENCILWVCGGVMSAYYLYQCFEYMEWKGRERKGKTGIEGGDV